MLGALQTTPQKYLICRISASGISRFKRSTLALECTRMSTVIWWREDYINSVLQNKNTGHYLCMPLRTLFCLSLWMAFVMRFEFICATMNEGWWIRSNGYFSWQSIIVVTLVYYFCLICGSRELQHLSLIWSVSGWMRVFDARWIFTPCTLIFARNIGYDCVKVLVVFYSEHTTDGTERYVLYLMNEVLAVTSSTHYSKMHTESLHFAVPFDSASSK